MLAEPVDQVLLDATRFERFTLGERPQVFLCA